MPYGPVTKAEFADIVREMLEYQGDLQIRTTNEATGKSILGVPWLINLTFLLAMLEGGEVDLLGRSKDKSGPTWPVKLEDKLDPTMMFKYELVTKTDGSKYLQVWFHREPDQSG